MQPIQDEAWIIALIGAGSPEGSLLLKQGTVLKAGRASGSAEAGVSVWLVKLEAPPSSVIKDPSGWYFL